MTGLRDICALKILQSLHFCLTLSVVLGLELLITRTVFLVGLIIVYYGVLEIESVSAWRIKNNRDIIIIIIIM